MTTGTTSARLSVALTALCCTALACAARPQTAAAVSTAVTPDGFDVRIGLVRDARRWIFATRSGYSRDCGRCLRVETGDAGLRFTERLENHKRRRLPADTLGGDSTSYLLGEQLDNLWAAVRAVGANGPRSLAAVVPPPALPPTLVTR
jgi:hypothetical protein